MGGSFAHLKNALKGLTMNKLFAPMIVTAAAALLAACGSDRSHYAASDDSNTNETVYTASNDSSQRYDSDHCPAGSKTATRYEYDNGLPASSRSYVRSERSTSSDYYSSSQDGGRTHSERYYAVSDRPSLGEEMYSRDGMSGDPNRDYSSDAGCSIKAKTGSWNGGRTDVTYRDGSYRRDSSARSESGDRYRSDNDRINSDRINSDRDSCKDKLRGDVYRSESDSYSSDAYSSSPDNSSSRRSDATSANNTTTSSDTSVSQPSSVDTRYTEVPGHYTNATPGGFSNSSAWSTSGARTEAPPAGGWSTTTTTVTSSSTVNQPMAATTTNANTDTVALAGDTSADARILSILNVKDQEEVEIGRLAQINGSSQEVKEYGARLMKDHTEHGAKVRSVASTAGITLMDPDQVKACIAKEKGKSITEMKDPIAELRELKGSEFDQKFAAKMKAGHTKLIAMVEKAQYDVKNPNVKDLLAKTLPTLREHEQMAAKLNSGENTDNYTSPDNR